MGTEVKKERTMPRWYPFAWSTRAISLSLNVILVGYVTFYSTDVLGLSAGMIGMLLLASKLVDAFTDLIVGVIVEKTNTRFGKGRPYELFILGTWIFTIFLFRVPDASHTVQYAYIFIMYALINSVCSTFLNGADSVYFVRAMPNKKDQITTLTVNGSVVMLSAIVANVFLPQIVNYMGTSKGKWSTTMVMLAVPIAIIGLGRFIFCKEVEANNKEVNEID